LESDPELIKGGEKPMLTFCGTLVEIEDHRKNERVVIALE
jgi:hypothetical protein